jgi:diguanylate cyclase
VIADVMRETRAVQESTQRSRGEIEELRTANHANAEIARLQAELEQTSELIRHDPLTGVLNRKGLDEALSRETAFAQRRGTPCAWACSTWTTSSRSTTPTATRPATRPSSTSPT